MLTPTVAAAIFEDYPTMPAEDTTDARSLLDDADDACLRGAWRLVGLDNEAFSREAFYKQLAARRTAAQKGRERGGRRRA